MGISSLRVLHQINTMIRRKKTFARIWRLFTILLVGCVVLYVLLWTFPLKRLTERSRLNILELETDDNTYECSCRIEENGQNLLDVLRHLAEAGLVDLEEDDHKRHPNLALELLLARESRPHCHLLPSLLDIQWRDVYWQDYKPGSKSQILLYGAYIDHHPDTGLETGVRLVVMSKGKHFAPYYCQFWKDERHPPVWSAVTLQESIDLRDQESDDWKAYILLCKVPKKRNFVPVAVSLGATPCERPSVLLKVAGGKDAYVGLMSGANASSEEQSLVQASRAEEWRVGVCGPALYFYNDDFSARLVEWAEIMKHLGVSKVFLYEYDGGMHPNVSRVLRYYEREGFFSSIRFSYPSPYMSYPPLKGIFTELEEDKKYSMEHIYYTDCIMRNMHHFRILAHIDPDEVPVLYKHATLPELSKYLFSDAETAEGNTEDSAVQSYKMMWRFFYPHFPTDANTPEHLHVLRRKWRLRYIADARANGKTIFNTRYVRSMNSHRTTRCWSGPCAASKPLPMSTVVLGHFRSCRENCDIKSNLMEEDTTLTKLKRLLLPNIENVLKTLKLLQ